MTEDEYRHTFVPLRDYIERRLYDMDEAMKEARRVMEMRMKDFPVEYVRRGDLSELLAPLTSKVEILSDYKNRLEGMASNKDLGFVRWLSIFSLLLGAAGLIVHLLMSK